MNALRITHRYKAAFNRKESVTGAAQYSPRAAAGAAQESEGEMNTTYAMSPSAARIAWGTAEFRAVSRRLARRVRAMVRLLRRRRRAKREFDDLRHLDERTLRDLGVSRSELTSVAAELGGRVAASRRRTEFESMTSSASRFRIRAIDSSL